MSNLGQSAEEKAVVDFFRNAMSRRRFMGVAGATAGMAALAACTSGGSKGKPSPTFPADVSSSDKNLTWANWTLYLDYNSDTKSYPTLDAFQKQTGITASYREDVDDNNTFWGKVNGQLKAGQDIGYDIVTVTDWMAGRFIRNGYAQPLDEAKIPNKTNILTSLSDVPFDPGRKSSLTWQTGLAGLVWNKSKIPGGLKSVADLWKPELKGKVTVLSEMRDTMGCILLANGVDISGDISQDDFQNALDVLAKQLTSGQIYKVQGNSYKEDLISGKAWAGIMWSGDIFQLNAENNDQWGFILPDSGGTLWSDNMLIPSTSSHQSNAMKLMNFYYDPKIAAQVAAYVNYICPVQGAQAEMEKIDPKLASSELIFPTDATLKNAHVFSSLTPANENLYNKLWLNTIGV